MSYFSQQELAEIRTMVADGVERLDAIKADIDELIRQSKDARCPSARLLADALAEINPHEQLRLITQSRSRLRLVLAKCEIDELSEDDADKIVKELDGIKDIGRTLNEASKRFQAFMWRNTESN